MSSSKLIESRCLVVSAVNFTEGGPLTILREFVNAACRRLSPEWRIVVFAHDRHLLAGGRAEVVEIPYAKRSWLRRLRFEFIECRQHAKRLCPDLWVSLHDISPNVGSVAQAVYCHNPSPFFPLRVRDAFFDPSFLLFHLAYGLLYRVNIRKNRFVIVQQQFLREQFKRWTDGSTQVVVAHPISNNVSAIPHKVRAVPRVFLYPALARVFKNIELLCKAAEVLQRNSAWQAQIVLTISGTENRYARWLRKRFGGLRSLQFVGRLDSTSMQEKYVDADCLLFPSRMETWGLPISEAKARGLPMFVADMPYAREAVGSYEKVEFIEVDDHRGLADKLLAFVRGNFEFRPVSAPAPEPPFASNWDSLVELLTRDNH